MTAPRHGGGAEARRDALASDIRTIRHSAPPQQAYRTRAALLSLRRQRTAERLHRLGARALAELLSEIGAPAWRIAEEYAHRLSPELLAAVGGDRFPPPPLRMVDAA